MSLTKLQESKLKALPGFWEVRARLRCDTPLPYAEAQKIVQKTGIKTKDEFRAWKRPDGIPSAPEVIYKGKGWDSWPEFFGTGTTDYVSYEKAQKIVRKAGIKTATEFWAWKLKPEGMPSTPYVIYKDKGWESWQEFFGTGVPFVALPYRDSQKLVQKAGIKTATEFYAWKPKPFGVPSTPDRDYKGRGWKNWPEFFGKKDYRKRRKS